MSQPLTFQATIETPELVGLRFELAGIGTRGAAYLIDFTIRILSISFAFWLVTFLNLALFESLYKKGSGWIISVLILFYYAQEWLYHLLFEWLWNGQTPGKKLLGIRVIKDSGRPIHFIDSCLRNLCRPIDTSLPLTIIGIGWMFFHPQHRRPGDLLARTLVVQIQEFDLAKSSPTLSSNVPNSFQDIVVGLPLHKEDIEAAHRFLVRRDHLEQNLRIQFAVELATGIWEKAKPGMKPPWQEVSQTEEFLKAVAMRQ